MSGQRMPPGPACDYYWPPALEDAVAHYEQDLTAKVADQIAIERVFILGAGFSAAFQFTTARDIVTGTLAWAEHQRGSKWFVRCHEQITRRLDLHFPLWRRHPPDLYAFVDTFFPSSKSESRQKLLRLSDPLSLTAAGLSWENRNCAEWFEQMDVLPNDESGALRAFEALAGTYLIAGKNMEDIHQPWAMAFARQLRPSDVILTFNWDVIPEVLMVSTNVPFCRYDWDESRVKLVKLHGSADLIGTPNPLMRVDLEHNTHRFECVTECLWRARTADDVLVRTRPWPFGRLLFPSERYNKEPVLIMPPHYLLGYGFHLIQFNWRKAKTALERANEIHIIGYSLPAADIAFRGLVADVCGRWSPHVTVDIWNPDIAVEPRARELFGDHLTFHQALASNFQRRI